MPGRSDEPAAIDPMPPVAPPAAPGLMRLRAGRWLGSGPSLLRNATAYFARMRDTLGDTYVVDAFGYRLFCVFSPLGVKSLYALPEKRASFGLATYTLFQHKIPAELFVGRRNAPHHLFAGEEVERYLGDLERAMTYEIDELGASGTFEAFAEMRRLGHRLGFASWAGTEAASPAMLARLIAPFDRLDASESFVRPAHTLITQATGKIRERRAMRAMESAIGEILDARERASARRDDFLDLIWNSFADLEPADRKVQAARDVIVLHMGSQSNLYAALAWTLVNLLLHPDYLRRVADGDETLLEQCASESIRMAQRSITLRQVIKPIDIADEHRSYRISPGAFVTTMLSVNNCSAAPGLERFDPQHYDGRRLAHNVDVPCKEIVSTFGHGIHSCPAQRFAISAIRVAISRLLDRYELEPQFTAAEPLAGQLGAVARAARPCRVRYRRRR